MRRSLYIVALIAGVIGGCYLRPSPSPGFRYACKEDSDCLALDCSGAAISLEKAATLIKGCDSVEVKNNPSLGLGYRQSCVDGLCEYPCELATFQKDCPTTEGFVFCFNGNCANLCGNDDATKYGFESNDDYCSEPQGCIPIAVEGLDPAVIDTLIPRGSGQGGLNLDGLAEGAGFCGERCDAAGAPACPAGQYCTGALCLPGCSEPTATPCKAGSVCKAFGEFSSCLVTCDSSGTDTCGTGQICVKGLEICQPTCVGEDKVDCADSFECDAELSICLPIGGSDSDSDSDSSGDSST